MTIRTAALLVATCCSLATPALGQTPAADKTTGLTPNEHMVWGAVGFQGDLGGSLNSSGIGNIAGARGEIDANTWGERYDAAIDFRLGGAHNLTDLSQVFGEIHWEQAEADMAEVGLLGNLPLNAKFSDLQGWGFDFGLRRFVPTSIKAKPFVALSFGLMHFTEISVDFNSSTNAFVATGVPFYDASWVAQWRLGTGFLWDVTPRFGWQATLDLKYSGVLSDVSGLGTLGFERVNDTGNRWSLPILGGVYMKF